MRAFRLRAALLFALAGGLMVPSFAGRMLAQDKEGAAETKKEAKAEGKEAKARGEGKGKGGRKEAGPQMPDYYDRVVDGEQREKIRAILAEHEPTIKQLRLAAKEANEKVAAAVAKRNAAAAALLTPAQQEKLAKLEAEAKEKRGAKMTKAGADDKNATASAEDGKKVKKDDADDKSEKK